MADPFKPPRQFKAAPSNKSKGILDDFAIRKSIASREGYFNSINWSNGTDGSVLFMANNILAQDNLNLYWDNVAKQLELTKIKLTAAGTAAIPALKFNDRNTGIYSGGSNIISFSTDGTHKMSILENGNVGIGTASPNTKLDVRIPSGGGGIIEGYSGNVRTHKFEASASNDGQITLRDGSNANKVIINTNGDTWFDGGNVGIGTASPDDILDIEVGNSKFTASQGAGDVSPSWIVQETEVGGEAIAMLSGSNSAGIYFSDTGRFSIAKEARSEFTDGDLAGGDETNLFTILADGNVGIDTITPTTQFSVKEKAGISPIGGIMIKLTNKTGSNSVAGQLVHADTSANDAVKLTIADGEECIGVFLDAGVSDGSEAWVVISGIADVAMEDNTTATRGNWVRTSITEAGYADATNAFPPSPAAFTHFNEIGNCIETVTATGIGTHVLARCVLHFN